MKDRILIIEDSEEIVKLLKDILTLRNFEIEYVFNGIEGISKVKENLYSLVILDLQLPDMDGFNVLEEIKKINSSLPVIVLTGFGTTENIVRAIKMGAEDFIEKPFEIEKFLISIDNVLKTLKLEKEVSKLRMIESILELNKSIITLSEPETLFDRIVSILENLYSPEKIGIYLYEQESKRFLLKKSKIKKLQKLTLFYPEKEIFPYFEKGNIVFLDETSGLNEIMIFLKGKEKSLGLISLSFKQDRKIKEEEIKFFTSLAIQISIGLENALLLDKIQESYINTIASLVKSLEAKDKYTKGHSEEVAKYSVLIGNNLGLTTEEIEILRDSSFLHDLGKLGIKDDILLKPTKLNKNEFDIIKQHPIITVEILSPLNLPKEIKEACLYHHEKIDGSGYPFGLKGKDIPLYAKIIAVADAFSAMTSDRPYRKRLILNEAFEELKKNAGLQFDEQIVEVFLNSINKIKEVI
ncbi:MAG: response regulator [bacterium]|nr:response regulator [bacterium]